MEKPEYQILTECYNKAWDELRIKYGFWKFLFFRIGSSEEIMKLTIKKYLSLEKKNNGKKIKYGLDEKPKYCNWYNRLNNSENTHCWYCDKKFKLKQRSRRVNGN
jgi:uncharacterized paraquat-inducible protein A